MMSHDWLNESGIALSAVTEAGILLWDKKDSLIVSTKETYRDLVSEYDLVIHRLIKKKLSDTLYPILSEESDTVSSFLDTKTCWIMDPIDGTVNFAHNIPLYAVSLGLQHQNSFVVGAVFLPALKEIYFTHGNASAYLNEKKLTSASKQKWQDSLFACTFSSDATNAKRNNEYQLFGDINDNSRGCLRLGSAAVAICFVAAKRIDCAFGVNVKIWDVAGALAIAQCAGYTIYLSRKPNSFAVDFAVGSAGLVAQVQSMITALEEV